VIRANCIDRGVRLMRTRSTSIQFTIALAIAALTRAGEAAEGGYYTQPALHNDRLIFVSEGDLWSCLVPQPVSGEEPSIIAHRLTSSDGSESMPQISPDGRWLAFAGQYDGNTDVYVMPVEGGAPRRLTFHSAPDAPLAWMPDGQAVLFRSTRQNPLNHSELWRVSVTGGMPRRFEFGECSLVGISSTGRRIAFNRWSNETWTWKRYRGGTAPDIWVGDLDAGIFQKLTDDPANDLFPMWLVGRLFFLSDRAGTANIFSCASDGSDVKQHTRFAPSHDEPAALDGYDARWPSADAQRSAHTIAFSHAGGLCLLDVADDSIRRLQISMASDRAAARQRFAPLADTMTEYRLSHDGKQLLIGSRGELLMVPIEPERASMQITRSSGSREWGATLLDATRIAMVGDSSGQQQVMLGSSDGSALPSSLTDDLDVWLFPPQASPDGRWLAFADKTMRLHLLDMQTLARRQIEASEAGEITDYRFSPDSLWLAYAKPMSNGYGAVSIYSLRTGRSFAISDGLWDDSQPRWDPAGKYLYFVSRRNLNPLLGEIDFEHVLVGTQQIFAVPLASDVPPPFKVAAASTGIDLEAWAKKPDKKDGESNAADDNPAQPAAENGNANAAGGPPAAGPPSPQAPMRVDTDGLQQRIYLLPIDAGTLDRLEAQHGSITYLTRPREGLLDEVWPVPPLGVENATLHRYDFVKAEGKVLAEKVSGYSLSGDLGFIAYPKDKSFQVVELSEGAEPKSVDLAETRIRIDAQAEWRQMLDEAWRLQRDFYWAPNFAGVDWPAMKSKYEALLPRIGTREELNDLIGQMLGELGTSHSYIWGGQPFDSIKPVGVGLLGADIEFDGRGFRIARILPSQPWLEDLDSPLAAPHLGITPGMYLFAINGVDLRPGDDVHSLLQDSAGKLVSLAIAEDPGGANRRVVQVKALESEQELRYADWVETNRKHVAEKSGGVLGYLHIPDMDGAGLSQFSRLFYPQIDKKGLIVDVRDNNGGFISQMIIERLARKVWAFQQPRHGRIARYPDKTLHGHKAVLIDQFAGSDGDIFPASFRMNGLGPLIGTRTWGGVVGIRADKPFVDGGLSTQPEFAWWDPKDGWSIENIGVSPDIEVHLTPEDRAAGRDPQLDKAIEVLMQKLAEEPMELPPPPPWPVRTLKN
jgi:tricorn protease